MAACSSSDDVVVLVGVLPSPQKTHGLAEAFRLLVDALESTGIPVVVVDRASAGRTRAGAVSWKKIASSAVTLVHYARSILSAKVVYITLGSSIPGFIRDSAYILPAAVLRRRIVAHLHGAGYGTFYDSLPGIARASVRAVLSQVSSAIVLSESLRSQFGFIQDRVDIECIPNAVSPTLIAGALRPRERPRRPMRILYLSNLMRAKGYLEVLQAIAILRERGVEVTGSFCGGFVGSTAEDADVGAVHDSDSFRALVKQLGLEGCVAYSGLVTGEAKERAFREADVFVLPTYHPWEGQPISILEAMAFGLPVVTCPQGGIADIVQDGSNGLLVSPQAPADVADALHELQRRPDLYRELSARGVETVKAGFTYEMHVDRMMQVLQGGQ